MQSNRERVRTDNISDILVFKMIDGVQIEKEKDCALCKITNFSDSLKAKIRNELSSIINGEYSVETVPEQADYKYALRLFLERYRTQSKKTKKGMIGELLAHVLASTILSPFKCISVLKNKEENSIKKGFDIIYLDNAAQELWYSEVKSGRKRKTHTAAKANNILLARARRGIKAMLASDRITLWDSAVSDVALIMEGAKQVNTKRLLMKDSPIKERGVSKDKNVILFSALYETPTNPVKIDDLKDYLAGLDKTDFKGVAIFSIQKETYDRVANFLEAEIAN